MPTVWRSALDWRRATVLSSMGPTNYAMARRSTCERERTTVASHRKRINPAARSGVRQADKRNEPVTALHTAAGGNHIADGSHHAIRLARIPIPADRSAA